MNTKITNRIKQEVDKLGSQSAVANRCGISKAALSTYLSGKYGADVHDIENRIMLGLGIVEHDWNIAITRDIQMLHNAYTIAKDRSIFLAVSDKAGVSKSASIDSYETGKKDVYVVRCREWTGRMFLDELVRILGIELPKGYVTMDTKITRICSFFKERRGLKCQLLIDEADKLRPSALRTLIPIYNECKRMLSVVIAGTDNLEKEIKNGVRYARKGYDELDSRFGRRYLKVMGNTRSDVAKICKANGITEDERIEKIWKNCPKIRKKIETQDVEVVKDLRLLENLILFAA